MGRPVVSNWAAVNQNINIGGTPQVLVNFTPANDSKNLWFRLDLKQGSDSWLESDWIPVTNKNAGSITLSYILNGTLGIPGDWGGSKQISLQAKLMWGEDGRGRGGEIGRKNAMFNILPQGGGSVSGGTTPGTRPQITQVTAVNGSIPIGGPAQVKVKYNSDVSGYLRLDLKKQAAVMSKEWSPAITWTEGQYEHIAAGQNKEVTLTFTNVPTNWRPDRGVKALAIQIVWSAEGSGAGYYLTGGEEVFWVLSSDEGTDDAEPVITPTPEPIDTIDTTPTDTTPTDTTTASSGITKWLKDNWGIALLIGAFVLLVIPGRSSKGD